MLPSTFKEADKEVCFFSFDNHNVQFYFRNKN